MPPRFLQLIVISMVSCHTHASSLDADHAELLHSVREQLEGGGKVSETHISDLREALEENAKQVDLLTMLAYALLSRNQPDEAVTQMKKALKLDKQQGRNGADGVAKTLVKTLLRLNRFEEASQMYSTYEIPLDAATHSMLALRLAQGSQTEREGLAALSHSEKALEMAPQEPTTHLARGMALLMSGNFSPNSPEPVMDALTSAFELREKGALDSAFPEKWPETLEAHVHHTLGKLIATTPPEPEKNTRLDDAVLHFTKAAQLLPDHKVYKESLNHGYAAMIQREKALRTEGAHANDIVIDRNKLIVGKDEAPTTLTKDEI